MSVLHLDFETRSACDLAATGSDVYANDPTTDIWVAAYAFDDEPVESWWPSVGPVPKRIIEHISSGLEIWGHNVAFETLIANAVARKKYGWPEIKTEQTHCTMAMAYAMALPGALEKAAAATGISEQKDMRGHRLMLQMSAPRETQPDGSIIWWDNSEKRERLDQYCRQDVVVERMLSKRLLALSAKEREVWELDQKINRRGVAVDVKAVKKAIQIVEAEKMRLDAEMREVTGNQVATCKAVQQLVDFLIWRGVKVSGVAKADVLELLKEELPADCRKALLIRQEAAKSSTAKLSSMLNSASQDGRLRGLFQYHGAGPGRWAGRRIQPHNFPRPVIGQDEIENVFSLLEKSE